jgi:hypothetical protein
MVVVVEVLEEEVLVPEDLEDLVEDVLEVFLQELEAQGTHHQHRHHKVIQEDLLQMLVVLVVVAVVEVLVVPEAMVQHLV